MGVTLGVLQNANGWWGEGDDMIFIDDESKPAIIGTGERGLLPGELEFRRAVRRGAVRAPAVRRAADCESGAHRAASTAATAGTATIR